MKKLILLFSAFILFGSLHAQAPDYFNYQAVLRSQDGTPMANENVTLQVDLLKDHINGPSIYLESHEVQTNELGIVDLKIGDQDFFNEISWEEGPFFLSVTVNGNHMGTSQLLSVPYALYAKDAGNVDDDDPDPANELQTLSLEEQELTISGGNTVLLPELNTPWQRIGSHIYYPLNVGIGLVEVPEFPLDIRKNIFGDQDMALIRLRNLDEGPWAYVSLALEAYRNLPEERTFNRSELMLTSNRYNRIPGLSSMTAIKAGGNGFSTITNSPTGSIRFYTSTVQDSIVERIRISPEGRMGIGTTTPRANLHLDEGDIFIEDSQHGIILTSPEGKNFRIRVNDDGSLDVREVFL